MAIMTDRRHPVQSFSIRPAEGALRTLGVWEVFDRNGDWIGHRRTFCEAANWVREVCGLVDVPDLPDWERRDSDDASEDDGRDEDFGEDREDDGDCEDDWDGWMYDDEWAGWCDAVRDEEDRWAWLEDFCRRTEAVEHAEREARGLATSVGHGYGPDFEMSLWSSEGH